MFCVNQPFQIYPSSNIRAVMSYYNQNAQAYFDSTFQVDMKKYLRSIPGKIATSGYDC